VHTIPPPLATNNIAEEFPEDPNELPIPAKLTQQEKNKNMENELEASLNQSEELNLRKTAYRKLTEKEAKGFIDNIKLGNGFRFSQKGENPDDPDVIYSKLKKTENFTHNAPDNFKDAQVMKLSEYKDNLKNKLLNELIRETFTEMSVLEEPLHPDEPHLPFFQKGIKGRTIYPRLKKHVLNMIKINEFLDMYPINYTRMKIVHNNISALRKARFKQKEDYENNKKLDALQARKNLYKMKVNDSDKLDKSKYQDNTRPISRINENQFADLSFNLLTAEEDLNSQPNISISNNAKRQEVMPAENQPKNKISESKNSLTANQQEILNKLREDPTTQSLIDEASKNNNENITFSPEIHSTYLRDKPIQRTIITNQDSNILFITFSRSYQEINTRFSTKQKFI